MWNQIYNPLNNTFLSTAAAALPVVTLLILIASNKVKAHIAAVIALIVANFVAIVIFTMPAGMSLRATVLGIVTGFFPIGWIVLNVIFLYRLTVEKGVFETRQNTIGGVTTDRRLQLLLVAVSFGPFADRQYRTRRLWRSRYTDRRPCQRDGPRSVSARRDGRPPAPILLVDRAVLADLGLCWLEGHEGYLAGDPGHRRVVRDPAV